MNIEMNDKMNDMMNVKINVQMNGKHGLEPLCARCHSKAKSSQQAVGEPVSPLKKKRQPRYVCLRVHHVTCRERSIVLIYWLLEVKHYSPSVVCVCVVGVSVAYEVAGGGSTCACRYMLHAVGVPRI